MPGVEYKAAIQAMPPSVSVQPFSDRQMDGNSFSANPYLLWNSLLQVMDETDTKRRVQRYRNIEQILNSEQ
ncbi:unnamed protein product, partial [Brenthis ino]